ncbi:type II toxin-antitoxin system HipA family toxin [Falsiroseomonas selenitidurans]|uniref:Type II toxin-antitoxin system HipA family toxin n=1 Tax=Falsiroseomonas selenitidurans TaxID=2716335 RepID=A0ABX1DZE4_9PROT|nr:HipA domain-containing protein [Falsiroseomonas selenitidurans]NKC30216.1 type II toxin-antitoxin system HipA family toxin [Falsiroseomonas selenitidurans]
MAKSRELHLQVHAGGRWNDAAQLTLSDPDQGWQGPSKLVYDDAWVFATDPDFTGRVRGWQALSVRLPPSLELHSFKTWPPFLLDLLPQGHARKVLAGVLGLHQHAPSCDAPLLLRAAGDPIGNIRLRQAWDAERKRVKQAHAHPGLTLDEMFERADALQEYARDFAAVASGSSGVQGAWPKLLMTRNAAGRWLPDPMVPDDQATGHAIIKWVGDKGEDTRLILAAEAPYLELARAFGLRCARPLRHRHGTLFIPRFDREIADGRVVRLGQESIVAAAGVAAFGHQASHEAYLGVIQACCDDPAAEATEYLLRDVLNLALGNPDNHGRNTALQKAADGGVRLTPLYDFCPMRLDSAGIARSTTWRCMRPQGGVSRDLKPDWQEVCRVAAGLVPALDAEVLMEILASKADTLRRMPELARGMGVPEPVIERAMGFCDQQADALATLGRRRTRAPR